MSEKKISETWPEQLKKAIFDELAEEFSSNPTPEQINRDAIGYAKTAAERRNAGTAGNSPTPGLLDHLIK